MNDQIMDGRTPAEEDPALHRYLVMLPAVQPTSGFEDRVLSRVWRPYPQWHRRVSAAGLTLVETGEIWFWVGALALGSILPLVAGVTLTATFSAEIGSGIAWLVEEGIPSVWAAASADVMQQFESLATRVSATGLDGRALGAVGLGCVTVLAGCAVGLRRTITRSR
jgi:hypothetical protein